MRSLFKSPKKDALDARIAFDEYKRLVNVMLPDAEIEDGIGYWYLQLGEPMNYQIIQIQQFPRILDAVSELRMWAMRLSREQEYMKKRMEEPS